MNRLNVYAVGSRRSNRQPRLDALVWTERGHVSARPHAHALIERPRLLSAAEFAAMIARAWQAQPFGYDEVRVEEVRDIERSVGYNAKTSPAISGNLVYFHKEREVTVKAYRGQVMRQMGAESLPDLVTMAARLGLQPAPRH